MFAIPKDYHTSVVPVATLFASVCFSVFSAPMPVVFDVYSLDHFAGSRSTRSGPIPVSYIKQGVCHRSSNTPPFLHLRMAPSSDNSVKNVGSVHLTTLVVLSNPRPCGPGLSIALDLHLLLKSPEGEAIEKTILARLYNHTKISFAAPRVCFVSVGVCPSPLYSVFCASLTTFNDRSPALKRTKNIL